MNTVSVYDARNAVLEGTEQEFGGELPEIPKEFQEALAEAGGYCDGFQNVRVVSGLDPNITEFYGDRFWRKYATHEHIINEYAILHQPNGQKRILSKKESEILEKSKHKNGIIIPVNEHKVIEHGIPRYFLEYYKPAESFGLPEIWEANRYFQDEDGKTVDLMGEFPSEGMYVTWFCIEEPVLKDGVVVSTKFRALDDIVLEFIKQEIERQKESSAAAKHEQSVKENLERMKTNFAEMKKKIRDIVTERVDKLVN